MRGFLFLFSNEIGWEMSFLTADLPIYIKDSLLCFTLVNSKVIDGGPDIATCNSNGYLYEIKNKKIIRSLNLFDKGVSMSSSYLLQNEKLELYYTVLVESGKLLIIRRANISQLVMRTYDEVKEFQVYDFKCLGFPQIKINFINEVDSSIFTFPKEEPAVVKTEDDNLLIDEEDESNPLVESLEEKLQILNKHADELIEEYNLLNKQFSSKPISTEFGMVSVGSIKFSSPLKHDAQPTVKICDKWLKVFGSNLIIGMKIHNGGSETVKELELVINHEEIKDYVYRIFHTSHALHRDLFSTPTDQPFINSGEDAWLIGAFRVPAFLSDSALSVPFCVMSGDLRTCLARDSLEVTVLDVVSRSVAVLEEEFTVEDLMAIRTVKSETQLELRTEDVENDKLASLLANNLGFRKIKHVKDELFYCTSAYLNQVLIGLRQITENPAIWKMLLFTSEDSQIYFVVNALYDLLPENTAISV